MDLLLKVQQERRMTTIMVTHDSALECYANRIIFVADGRIVGHVVNSVQTRLDFDSYSKYLQTGDEG